MLPDPDPPEKPEKVYLRPLTSPRQDKMEIAAIGVLEARERAEDMKKELHDLQQELLEELKLKEIEGDAEQVIRLRYFEGYGVSRIANELLGAKTERERNRVKYLLKTTEARLNS